MNPLVTLATSTAIVWKTKNGTVKTAHTATMAAHAPKLARIATAQSQDLTNWNNGQFGPLLRDIRAMLTPKQLLSLIGDDSININGRSKIDAMNLFMAVINQFPAPGMPKAPKGAKLALLNTVQNILDFEMVKAANLAAPVDIAPVDAAPVNAAYCLDDMAVV